MQISPATHDPYPLDFSLSDINEHPVLYIDDNPATDHVLKLEIINNTYAQMRFMEINESIEEQCHFELHFTSGTLSDKTIKILLDEKCNENVLGEQDCWSIRSKNVFDGIILYFTCTNPAKYLKQFGIEYEYLDRNQRVYLLLHHITAKSGVGARGANVYFRSHGIGYSASKLSLSQTKHQHMEIISHRGKRNIPLNVGFTSSNRILNDKKTPNTLSLKISHANHHIQGEAPLILDSDSLLRSGETYEGTVFILSLEIDEENADKKTALCTKDEASKIEIKARYVDKKDGKIIRDFYEPFSVYRLEEGINGSASWRLRPPHIQLELNENRWIEVEIEEIVSSLPLGLSNLQIRYKNIRGYWDGQYVLQVEKSPISIADNNHVGIFTTPDDECLLNINGSARISGLLKQAKYRKLPLYDRFRGELMCMLDNMGFVHLIGQVIVPGVIQTPDNPRDSGRIMRLSSLSEACRPNGKRQIIHELPLYTVDHEYQRYNERGTGRVILIIDGADKTQPGRNGAAAKHSLPEIYLDVPYKQTHNMAININLSYPAELDENCMSRQNGTDLRPKPPSLINVT